MVSCGEGEQGWRQVQSINVHTGVKRNGQAKQGLQRSAAQQQVTAGKSQI